MHSGLFAALASSITIACCLVSCQQAGNDTVAARPPAAANEGAIPADDLESIKERMSREEWEAATQGVSFDNGVMSIIETPVRADDALADQLIAQGNDAFAQGHHMDSVKAFIGAAKASPSRIDAYKGVARGLLAEGRLAESEAAHGTIVQLEQNNVDSLFELAMMSARRADHAEAIERMQAVLAVNPDHGQAHERLAIWNYYINDFDSAWQHVDAAQNAGVKVPGQFLKLLEGAGNG